MTTSKRSVWIIQTGLYAARVFRFSENKVRLLEWLITSHHAAGFSTGVNAGVSSDSISSRLFPFVSGRACPELSKGPTHSGGV
jgi:hypothetical protein